MICIAILAAIALSATAINVPLNSTILTESLKQSACLGQQGLKVCHPFSQFGFIDCKKNIAVPCARGIKFDYILRKCMADAKPCTSWMCPVGGGPALSRPIGTFGLPGNLTISLPKKDSFHVICPVNGHCQGGMVFKVNVACPAPLDRAPYTFIVDFDEKVTNDQAYPKRHPDLHAFCGDSIFLYWDEPIHIVQIFNTSAAAKPLWSGMSVQSYIPQPVIKCPVFPADQQGLPVPRPGIDTVIVPLVIGNVNATSYPPWVANETGSWDIACPLSNHCRLGMIFNVKVSPAPPNYTPKRQSISFVLTGSNYPNLDLFVGDSLSFFWQSPFPQAHAVYAYAADATGMIGM